MANELSITVGQCSQAGRKEINQDAYGVLVPPEPLLTTKGIVAIIADGMSGSEAGQEASEYSVKGFLNDYFSTPESWTVKTAVQKVLMALNRWLYGQTPHYYGSPQGWVTTLSVLVIKSTTAYLFHIGDTRIYRLRNQTLECLTQNHRIRVSKDKEYLSRAMGIKLHIEIDYRLLTVEVGDYFILMTDGVYEYLNDREIARIILENVTDLKQASQQLVAAAFANNSPDNLTCQIMRVEHLPLPDVNTFYQTLTELPFPPPLSPGMHLDGYHILRQLHASNRTQLYLALDELTQTQVVLKTPSLNFSDNPVYLDLFLHEEWIGKRLHHLHVMKVYEQRQHRQCLYYVAEYIQGQTLRQWMHDHPQPTLSEVRAIIKQIAAGLRSFHRMEMIHQDLKPENIMIDHHGTIKLIDFGSTKIAGLEEITTPIERINLLGTKNYTAPEYLLGYTGTPRADLFSLGVITYELLTGQLPYSTSQITHTPHRLSYISACSHNPALPTWIDGAIKKAVHPNSSNRYEVLSEFLYDLSHPNPRFIRDKPLPLLERNPVAFWRTTTLILLIINILLLLY